MKTFLSLKLFFITVFVINLQSVILYAQTTAIPDPNFEQALIDLGIDSDGIINGQVLTSDIENVIVLNVNNKNISDLTGIEGFTALEDLNAGVNQLSTVNLTNNLNLKHLHIAGNQLTNIDLSNNINLDFLIIAANPLQNIDLSANTALTHLNANGTHSLSILDLSNNLQLEYLSIDDAWLDEIDLTTNTALKTLYASGNFLTNIDLSNNINLEFLEITDNLLEALDLSNNPLLKELYCGNPGQIPANEITSLDLSNNPNLEILHAENLYPLTSLNLKNGNNIILTDLYMDCMFEGDPCVLPLNCVEVDDEVAANNNQFPYAVWYIEANFVYSEDCSLSNSAFENLTSFFVYPNPATDMVSIKAPETQNILFMEIMDINGTTVRKFNSGQTAINIADLKAGFYFLNIHTHNNTVTKKFIKK